MAPRPIWHGHLRLALVSCPVALYNARRESATIRFNLINPETGNRIRMITQDAETGQELQRRGLVKGYEFRKDHYVLLTDEDFDSVKVESSTVMNVEKFIDLEAIDPIYYDASYYLAPEGRGSEDIYAVVREAILQTGKVALSRVVIAQRERTVALRPMGAGLSAHTLYEDREINSSKELFEDVAKLKPDPEMVKLAAQLIERQAGTYEPGDLEDHYEARLRALIDAKLKGEGLEAEAEESIVESNVVDLMAALRKSLAEKTPEPVSGPKQTTDAPTKRRTREAPKGRSRKRA